MAFLLPHTFVFSFLLQSFWAMMLITKALKEEVWTLKYAFSVFVVKLFGFSLSIGHIARPRHSAFIPVCQIDFRSGEHETKQQTADAPASGLSRKRKRRQSDVKISETKSSNTPTHRSPSSCHGDDFSCHGNRGPKRQKLNHSHYSITLDEDPTSLDVPRVAKVTIAVQL